MANSTARESGARRLAEKRVYWNPSAQQHEEIFSKNGFTVVLCEKRHALKNGADNWIALDFAEITYEKSGIQEVHYIL
jgi:hypothetical protein